MRGPKGGTYRVVNGKKVYEKKRTLGKPFTKDEAKHVADVSKKESSKFKEGTELYHLAMHNYHKNMAISTGYEKHKKLAGKHFEISDHLAKTKEHLASMNLPKHDPYNKKYGDAQNIRTEKLLSELRTIHGSR